ncbi:MAG: heavy metal translocating P-type ATPase [Candidatus Rifleibacteriota bacterium]
MSSRQTENDNRKQSPEKTFSSGLKTIVQLKIVNAVIATVFLLTGMVYRKFFPQQAQVGELLSLIAALSVFIPVFINAVKGFFVSESHFMTEQLVMFATLALIVNGDLEVATLIPIIMVVGHLLEEKSIIGVEEAINTLRKLSSNKAHLLQGDKEKTIEISELKINDEVVIYPGETVPVDGTVVKGTSLIDQAHVTGESAPAEVEDGNQIFAGTMNINGKLVVRVNRTADNSLLSNIVALLEKAGSSKTPIIKIIEKYMDLYFPAVIMIAAITLFVTHDISRLVTVLVISCPCAFVLASPSAMIAALVLASRRGIMIRNSAFVEAVAGVDTLVFDKTGTITSGIFQVVNLHPEPEVTEQELLRAAGICAAGSIHPVSQAVNSYLNEIKFEVPKANSQEELHGKGVRARVDNTTYLLGKEKWVWSETGCSSNSQHLDNSFSTVWVAIDQKILGYFTMADLPRPELKKVLAESREAGVEKLVLLTGDKKSVGEKIGRMFGFDCIESECLPQHKLDLIKKMQSEGHRVMFIGDGINDALALKAGDIGVAIGQTGADIAIQSSDITLKNDQLTSLPFLFKLSKAIHLIINQNIIIGTGFGLVMIAMATLGAITPVWGAIAHNLGTFFVLVNSARLLREKPDFD